MLGLTSAARRFVSGGVKAKPKWEYLVVEEVKPFVFSVQLNRPDKLNAFNEGLWREVGEAFNDLGDDPSCRSVVLSGNGKMFSAGIDLATLAEMGAKAQEVDDVARKATLYYGIIRKFQSFHMSIEKCPKPVICAVHGACIGAATNMATFADVRLCTKDAWFQVKEAEIGLAADVGALQQLPKIIGSQSLAREICLTARKFHSEEAKDCGFVSRVFEDKEAMMSNAFEMAVKMASMSPVAVQGTKISLNYSRDHTVEESLDHIATRNMTMLQSEDLMKAAMAMITKSKEPPEFAKL